MRKAVFILILMASSAFAQTIVPSNPAVNQGATLQFTEMQGDPGTWSCTGTDSSGNATSCAGSITAAGLYTAPASVTAQQTEGGYQLLPNNHVFNVRIDSLPQNSNNTTWMNVVNNTSGVPTFDVIGMPINYIDNTAPQRTMNFQNGTTSGTFRNAQFPNARLESSYFGALSNAAPDHHFLQFNTVTGVLSDFYQYYAQAPVTGCTVNGSNVVVCTITPSDTSSGFGPAAAAGSSMQIGGFTAGDTWANVKCPMTSATPTSITFTLTGAAGCATHGAASTTTSGQVTMNTGSGTCAVAGTCNSQGGAPYNFSDYPLFSGIADAAGMALQPLQLRLEEWNNAVANNGTINHALRFDFAQGFLASSFIWPATAFAADGGTVPFGSRWRLKSSFSIGSYSAADQILLKQLQQYGIIAADGGNNWAGIQIEANHWPANYITASTDLASPSTVGHSFTVTNSVANGSSATITVMSDDLTYSSNNISVTGLTNCPALNGQHATTSVTGTTVVFNTSANCATHSDTGTINSGIGNYMEAVDESGLQPGTAPQNCVSVALCGVTTHNREMVTFTRTSDSATATVDVALQGVAVNFTKDYLDIMAGTPAQTLTALVNIGGVTWSMNPSITGAALSSNGVFTAPASVTSPQTSTITATSTVNGSVSASMTLTVYPNPIRIIPSIAGNYTDSFGNSWYGGLAIGTSQAVNAGCCAHDGSFTNITDKNLWSDQIGDSSVANADTRLDILVPNGVYQVTYRFGVQNAAGVLTNKFAVQGNIITTVDMATISGGVHQPFSEVTNNVTVTDNHLRYTIYSAFGGTSYQQPISSFSIIPGAVARPSGSLP